MKRLCVFCGANVGRNPAYRDAAVALGEELAARDIGLVYGGASVGLMGVVADAARARGAEAKRSIIFVTLVAGFAGTISFPVAHGLVQAFGWRSAVFCFGITAILVVAPLMWFGAGAVVRPQGLLDWK